MFRPVTVVVALVAAASLTSPVLATPPPDLIEALSAYAAAGVTPTMVAAAAGDHHPQRVRRAAETPAVSHALASHEEKYVILPSGHRPYVSLSLEEWCYVGAGEGKKLIGFLSREPNRSSSPTLSRAGLAW